MHFSLNTNSMPQFNSSSPQVPIPPPKQQMHIDLSPKIYSKSSSSKSNPKTISSKSKPKTNPKHSSKPNSKSNSKDSQKTDSNPKPLKYLKLSSSNDNLNDYSNDYHELLASSDSFASSSGWT